MRLKEIQIYNRVPFDNLFLHFDESNISILSGINGVGKTTIISYVVDALYEIGKKGFPNEFESTYNLFYRVSSNITILDKSKVSYVYLRFCDGEHDIDYIDLRNLTSEEEYNKSIKLENYILYNKIREEMGEKPVIKYLNLSDRKMAEKYFSSNILTYFPAYRYEQPGYLNEPYKVTLNFTKEARYAGYLPNPIESVCELPEIANWIMDIVLDAELYGGKENDLLEHLNEIFSALLAYKVHEPVRLGIGPRQNGVSRIQVVKRKDSIPVYPTIFHMSSGEQSLVCLFCELIRQADKIGFDYNKVSGIALVDEVDKHLHIRLQKEILPRLMKMFPNVQFIITSHSPFLGLGLANESKKIFKMYDLDHNGIVCTPYANELFEEVYAMMISENDRFSERYQKMVEEVNKSTRPLLITEGKTDWKHLKAALRALNIQDLDIDIYEYEHNMGDNTLYELLCQLYMIAPNRKIIGMFDRDNEGICKKTVTEENKYMQVSKNVYVFSIPKVHSEEYGEYTSIEFYYQKTDLLKETDDGRRLFLGEEFYLSGNSKCQNYQTRCKGIDNKVKKNGIIDEKVYKIKEDPELKKSIALSKDDFAQMILDKERFAIGFDFSAFHEIFSVVRDIIDN